MTALLAYVRGRPWLAPCFLIVGLGFSIMSLGISVAAHSWFGRYGFWLGILVVIGGLLLALAYEIGYRRARSGPPPDTHG
jgi:hypothetical protein